MLGGGPAGCAAATILARAGRPVRLIVHPVRHRAFGVGEGAPPGFDRAVDDVFGQGTFVAGDHLRSLGNRAAWGGTELLTTDFMFNPFGTGWHLDRLAFDASLLAAAKSSGVTISESPDRDAAIARFVIDATGRRAEFARRQGATRVADDRLIAVLATYERNSGDVDATTTVEAASDGWWYTSPIPRQRRVVAFLTDGDLVDPELRTRAGFDRRARRTMHIAAPLAGVPTEGPLMVSANTAHLETPCGEGWLAAGDAAASFDPVSSQGILTAVLMGAEAARCIDDPAAFAERYRSIVDQYKTDRRAIYALEDRWPDSPFWARRHSLERPHTTSL